MNATAKIIAPDQLHEWRAALGDRTPLAVVSGAFDLLQPGNLTAIAEARRCAPAVCVVIEPDDPAGPHAEPGQPQHPLAVRAETVAHVRDVSAVTTADPVHARDVLAALRPFIWVTGPRDRAATEPLAVALSALAEAELAVPRIAGCRTAEIHAAIRDGQTPIRPALPALATPSPAAASQRLVTVNGCFDVLHLGHVRFLAGARERGDRLCVLINDDASVSRYKGPTRPIFSEACRRMALLALDSVDDVVTFTEDKPLNRLRELRPAVHAKGGTYEPERVREEEELLAGWGGQIAFLPMVDDFSTTAYVKRVLG